MVVVVVDGFALVVASEEDVAEDGFVDGDSDAGDLEVGVGRRGPVPLHVDDPGRRGLFPDAQRRPQLLAHLPRLVRSHLHLVLLPLVVDVSENGQSRLRLVFEKGVVQHFVVDVHLSQLRVHPLTKFLFHHLHTVVVERVTKSSDPRRLDVI